MKKLIAACAAAAVMAIAPASALGKNVDAPGWKIKNACGKSFGQLVSGGAQPLTQPQEHILVRWQIGAAAGAFCLYHE